MTHVKKKRKERKVIRRRKKTTIGNKNENLRRYYPEDSFLHHPKLFSFLSSGEKELKKLIKSGKSPTGEHWNVDNIKNIVTAKNLCSCRDPITTAFDVSGFNLTA